MDYALIVYPLSSGYQQTFESKTRTTLQYLNLGELRKLPVLVLLKKLWKVDGCLYIPMEDINTSALLPILYVLASLTRASEIKIVGPEFEINNISRWMAALSIGSLVVSTIVGRYNLLTAQYEIKKLLRATRVEVDSVKNKKILYLKTNLWLGVKAGGSVGHIAGVVNGFTGLGKSVDFLSAETPVMLDKEVSVNKINALKTYGLPSEINLYRFHYSFLRQARKVLNADNLSFIYQRMSVANYIGVQLSRETGAPLIIEYNGSEVWIAHNWGTPLRFEAVAEKIEMACLKHAHLIVTISDVLRDDLLRRGVEPERIVVYPNCIDPRIYTPKRYSDDQLFQLKERYKIDKRAILVTFVGTFGQWHGVDVLAEVIRNLVKNQSDWLINHHVHFMLVGDGLKMQIVREILNDDECKPFCTLAGLVAQNETPAYLAASDVFISPHVSNVDGTPFFGSPTKLFEYMAMGRAIVASDLDQIGQIFDGSPHITKNTDARTLNVDTSSALLASPGDRQGLEHAIKVVVENPALRQKLGVNARALALKKYTWEMHTKRILDGLERVTNA